MMESTLLLLVVLATLLTVNGGFHQLHRTFYVEKDGHRMVESIEQDHMGVIHCRMFGDRYVLQDEISARPSDVIIEVDSHKISDLINKCNKFFVEKYEGRFHAVESIPHGRPQASMSAQMIYPGTKWCGEGNVADNYNDLGIAREADSCCRTHDRCNDAVPSDVAKAALLEGVHIQSSCECDEAFYSCLKNVKEDSVANSVGYIYFNILRPQCAKYDHPQTKCVEEVGTKFTGSRCQKYELDYGMEKKYQNFDTNVF